jgi:hypothetical protein
LPDENDLPISGDRNEDDRRGMSHDGDLVLLTVREPPAFDFH